MVPTIIITLISIYYYTARPITTRGLIYVGKIRGGEIRGGCGDLIARESISREGSNLIPKRGKLKKKKKKSGWIVEKRGKINIRV